MSYMNVRLVFLVCTALCQYIISSEKEVNIEEYESDFNNLIRSNASNSKDLNWFFKKYSEADEKMLLEAMNQQLNGKTCQCKKFLSLFNLGSNIVKKDQDDVDGFCTIDAQAISQARIDCMEDFTKRSKILRNTAEIAEDIKRKNLLKAVIRIFGCSNLCCLASNFKR